MTKILLGSTSFNLKKQILFSKLSGDSNPIHMDSIEARKSIAGECIVHGMHSFLWSLENLINEIQYLFSSYEINFKRYIPLNLEVSCFWDPKEKKLTIEKEGMIFLFIRCYGEINNLVKDWHLVNHEDILKTPKVNDLSEFTKEESPFEIILKSIIYPFSGILYSKAIDWNSEISNFIITIFTFPLSNCSISKL